jgi:hypothetical protein
MHFAIRILAILAYVILAIYGLNGLAPFLTQILAIDATIARCLVAALLLMAGAAAFFGFARWGGLTLDQEQCDAASLGAVMALLLVRAIDPDLIGGVWSANVWSNFAFVPYFAVAALLIILGLRWLASAAHRDGSAIRTR